MSIKYAVRNPDVVMREDEKEALMFNPVDGNMLCINKTGIFIWKLSDGTNSVESVIRRIADEYDVSLEISGKDCRAYLDDLERSGFIEYKI